MQTPQIAGEFSKSLVVAVTDASAVMSEANMQGALNGSRSAGNVLERTQHINQTVISSIQPLFDEQHLRQF